MELKELFESLPSVKDFDATDLDSNDLIDLLRLTGYNHKGVENSLSDAEANGHFAYGGFNPEVKSHKYVYAWYDDEDSEKWQVVALYVDLEGNGKIACDFGGMPIHEFDEEDEMNKYFKRVKANRKA